MTPLTTATQLCSFAGRRGGSDAERRASVWLRARLLEQGRPATVETFWSRPDWALAHSWHALFGVLASVVIVANARVGGALALLVLVSVAVDAVTGRSLGRRLTPERASQNIVALAPADHPGPRLVVTANYDAGRAGAVYRPGPRALAATLRRIAADGRLTPGWLGWLSLGAGRGTAVDLAQGDHLLVDQLLPEHLRDRHEAVALALERRDLLGQRRQRLGAVAAAVVLEDDRARMGAAIARR